MSDYRPTPGTKVVFPDAYAEWNRLEVYTVKSVYDDRLYVTHPSHYGDDLVYSLTWDEAESMAMEAAS